MLFVRLLLLAKHVFRLWLPELLLIKSTTNKIITPNFAGLLIQRSLRCALIKNNQCKWFACYCYYWICQCWSAKLSSFEITSSAIEKHWLFIVITWMELSLITGSIYLALPWLFTWQFLFSVFCNDNFPCLSNLCVYYIVSSVCSTKINVCFGVMWSKCVFEVVSKDLKIVVSLWQRQEV